MVKRKPFQGVLQIIRFNWHFYVLALLAVVVLFLSGNSFDPVAVYAYTAACLVLLSTVISLLVSGYVYDYSGFYKLQWTEQLLQHTKNLVNIHAGLDETSMILSEKFPEASLSVFDFYDASVHTEVSIKRARKRYPPYHGTVRVATGHLPAADNSADNVCIVFAAHEIRNDNERIEFFREVHRILKPSGKAIVVEHLRDIPNFLAYNIGYLHFLSLSVWLTTFRQSEMEVVQQFKITPFITAFVLHKQ